jgi:hypothetical protein
MPWRCAVSAESQACKLKIAEKYNENVHWQETIRSLSTWRLRAIAFGGASLAVYYGVKKVFETWDWYIDRFYDGKVADLLRNRIWLHGFGDGELREPPTIELPYYVKDIATALRRTESSVSRSLSRLRKRQKVEIFKNGWRSLE